MSYSCILRISAIKRDNWSLKWDSRPRADSESSRGGRAFSIRCVATLLAVLLLTVPAQASSASLLEAAQQSFNQQKFDDALVNADNAIQEGGLSREKLGLAYIIRAEASRIRGDLSTALAASEKAVQLNGRSMSAQHARALALLESDQFDASLKNFDFVLQYQPENTQVHCERAQALIATHRYENALRVCPGSFGYLTDLS
jgi:tetratricopeptide (TPR) repeat protein